MLLVLISWVIFAFEDLSKIKNYLCSMFDLNGINLLNNEALYYLNDYIVIIIIGIICSIPIIKFIKKKNTTSTIKQNIGGVLESIGYIAIVILCTASLVNNSFNPFLYFRF